MCVLVCGSVLSYAIEQMCVACMPVSVCVCVFEDYHHCDGGGEVFRLMTYFF